ncbi:MAG TPA: hypothetical protein EYP74_02630 [Anaerolineales bacterium]|nr:hypothetical protein [Anaerolineales bacterium]
MNFINDHEISPPPGIISTIKSGFDTTADKIIIILFPLLLDFFLWLGPRLHISNLLRTVQTQLETLGQKEFLLASEIGSYQKVFDELIAQDINLFGLLRTIPIGISSLMSQTLSNSTPLSTETISYQIKTGFDLILWIGGLTLAGWVLGSVYFAWVATASIKDEGRNLLWLGKTVLQASLLAAFWLIALIVFGTPPLIFFSVFMQINAILAQITFLFLAFFTMWLIVPIFFSAHGIFTNKENLFRSIQSSFHLSRFTLPTSSFFVISIVVLSQGFNFLWLTPPGSSWMMLVGILGHAFFSTSLLSASFIYYHDMNVWLETLLEKLDSNTTSAQTQ